MQLLKIHLFVIGPFLLSINDVRVLALEFISCIFCWVSREANMATHTLAKLFPLHNLPVICFPNNLPTPLEKV
jgi:hypothetical protein